MGKAGFYNVERIEEHIEDQKISADIVFNKQHPIFEGHFPGNPVVPGVCLLAILKDLLNNALRRNMYMYHANNIKFSASIDPRIQGKVTFDISYKELEGGILQVSNSVFQDETIFLKFKGNFK